MNGNAIQAPTELAVLLIEDDVAVRKGVEQALNLAGFQVRGLGAAEQALPLLGENFTGVIVSDVRLPGMDGLSLLAEAVSLDTELPIILITGHGDVDMAVEAMRRGAYDFIEKPFASERLVEVVKHALEKRALVLENRALRNALNARMGASFIGESAVAEGLRRMIAAVGPTAADVLLYGATGTGKEVVARALHGASGRPGYFVAINCGALPEAVFESEIFGHEPGAFTGALKRRIGKIEYAQGGTLFLDEIETMPPSLQVKFLRVLQERTVERLGGNDAIPVDCRVIAASKTDLKVYSEAGHFRSDLYYRLNVISIVIPPLRERREDIPHLFRYFAMEASQRLRCSMPTWSGSQMDELMAHDWPGNVRELRNTVERHVLGFAAGATINSHTIAVASAIEDVALPERMDRVERGLIAAELERAGGIVSDAAKALGIPRKTLYDKINRYGLAPSQYRQESEE